MELEEEALKTQKQWSPQPSLGISLGFDIDKLLFRPLPSLPNRAEKKTYSRVVWSTSMRYEYIIATPIFWCLENIF